GVIAEVQIYDTSSETIFDFNVWLRKVGVSQASLSMSISKKDMENMVDDLNKGTRFDGVSTISEPYELQGFVLSYFPTENEVTVNINGIFGDITVVINSLVFKHILTAVIELHTRGLIEGNAYIFEDGKMQFVSE
ncbi:unnamed protein product, partial [marine sediment metagenome]